MIMDYKEKLRLAKEALESGSYDKDTIEYIFPELRESEDEKIRKAIIKLVRQSSEVLNKQNQNNMINWLEKQGKEKSWKPSKEEMDVLYGLAYITNQYDEHKEEVITRLYQDLKREFFNGSSYENMFPTNTSTEDDVRRRSTIQVLEYARSLDAYNQYGKADIDKNIAWLEKQGKETSEKEFTFKALPRLLEMIEVSDRAKAYTEKLAVALDNEGYHTDAKIVRESIKIMNGEEVPMATMDEQKPQRMVSAEAKEAIYDKPTDEEMKELLRTEYEKGRADTIAEMKSSWSEEDERICRNIVNDIANDKSICKYEISKRICDEQINWLKSLKQRIGG